MRSLFLRIFLWLLLTLVFAWAALVFSSQFGYMGGPAQRNALLAKLFPAVINRNDPLHPVLGVQDWNGQKVMFCEQPCKGLLVHDVSCRHEARTHEISDRLPAISGKEITEADYSQQALFRIDGIGVVHRF
jgi:hypothetical protein